MARGIKNPSKRCISVLLATVVLWLIHRSLPSNYRLSGDRTGNVGNSSLHKRVSQGTVSRGGCDDFSRVRINDAIKGLDTDSRAVVTYLRSKRVHVDARLSGPRAVPDPEFELPLFRYPPLTDLRCLPDHTKSTVHLLSPRARYSVGDTVRVRVDLTNGYGGRRIGGGDDVRMWLKSDDGNSSIAATVSDLHNGSYIGQTVLRWSGVWRVRVSLTYSREFLQALTELRFRIQTTSWILAFYTNSRSNETTACLPMANITGYSRLCNYTVRNGGRPWYCGHPAGDGLNCSHIVKHVSAGFFGPLPFSRVMRQHNSAVDRTSLPKGKPADLRLVNNDIQIYTHNNADAESPRAACRGRGARETWDGPPPWGWLQGGAWQEAACRLTPLTDQRVRSCMQNTTLLLIGDSNQRLLYRSLKDKLTCDEEVSFDPYGQNICKNLAENCTILSPVHAQPFMWTAPAWTDTPLPQALRQLGDHRDPDRRLVVVVHYYIHFTVYAIHLFRHVIRIARADIERFLHAHPRAEVFLRGPHVTYCASNLHAHLNDHFAHAYKEILRQEFVGLLDRVRYLDTWDLTLASENLYIQPEPVLEEIVKTLLGYMCD